MESRLKQITEKVDRDGSRRPVERIFMCVSCIGEPIAKVTFRERLITLEAVGQETFAMSEEVQRKVMQMMFNDSNNY